MLQHAHGCGFLIKKCDVKGGEGGGQKVNVIVTLRSAKVVWKCPLIHLGRLQTSKIAVETG